MQVERHHVLALLVILALYHGSVDRSRTAAHVRWCHALPMLRELPHARATVATAAL